MNLRNATIRRKNRKGLCMEPFCRNRKQRGNYCFKCIKRKYNKKNPVRYAYHNLKSHAKARGKEFAISFIEFKKFAIQTNYINKKGRGALGYTIDRINPNKGYTIANIQILSNRNNVKKHHLEKSICPF